MENGQTTLSETDLCEAFKEMPDEVYEEYRRESAIQDVKDMASMLGQTIVGAQHTRTGVELSLHDGRVARFLAFKGIRTDNAL
ncbi:MAG: hypothetical protein GIW98_06445 [Candidatus Eremiobacteraeota bacterium]|nr:hypothetical protein [Candidatus Eremiobacteraeota bacterium]